MEGALGLEWSHDANNGPEGPLRESRRAVEGRVKWPVIDSGQGKFPLSTVLGIHLGPLYPHSYHQHPFPPKWSGAWVLVGSSLDLPGIL